MENTHKTAGGSVLLAENVTLASLEAVAELIPGGFFVYRADGNEELISFNSRMVTLFGCADAADFTAHVHNSFSGIVHPDDLETVHKRIAEQIASSSDGMDHVVYRFVRRDGTVGWFNDYGHLAHTEAFGDVYYVFVDDATHERETEEKAAALVSELEAERESRRRTAVIAGLTRDFDCVYYVDLAAAADGSVSHEYHAPGSALQIIPEWDEQSGFHQHLEMLREYVVHADDRRAFDEQTSISAILSRLQKEDTCTVDFRTVVGGADSHYRLIFNADRAADGSFAGMVVRLHCVDEEDRALDELEQLKEQNRRAEKAAAEWRSELESTRRFASRDPLTGVGSALLYNKKVAEINEKILLGTASPFAVVELDLNFLKRMNDTYGHEAGNSYLRRCCRCFCNAYKHSPVFRVGGDEFVSILTGPDYEQREALLAAVRGAVKPFPFDPEDETFVSFAAGMGVFDAETDETFEDVFKRADKDMYKDKTEVKSKLPPGFLSPDLR